MPASAATASAHFFPCSYWRSFTSKPSSRSMTRCGAERDARRRSMAARSSSWPGMNSAAMASMTCSEYPSMTDIAA